MRAYRRAGAAQAYEKAISFADLFRQLGQERRQKYFLDIARWVLGKSPPPAAKASLLIGFSRYNFGHDLNAAEAEAKEARQIFAARQDADGITVADLVLERVNDARNAELTHFFLLIVACSFLIWIALELRAELGRAIRAIAQISAAPFRMAAAGYRRFDTWWTGRALRDADEETRRFDRFRVHVLRLLFVAAILAAVAIDASTLTGPNLAYISKIRQIVASEGELLPPDMTDTFQALLDRDATYVLLAALLQVVVLAIGCVLALLLFGSGETVIFGLVQRLQRRAAPPIDPDARACTVTALQTLQRRFALALIVTPLGALAIAGFTSLPFKLVGFVLLGILFVTEAVLYALLRRTLMALPADQRNGAFAFASRIGSHQVSTLLFGILAYVYLLLPGFYLLASVVQRRLVLPPFSEVERQFWSVVSAGAPKYGTFGFTGEVAAAFSALKDAYDPGTGAGKLWTDLLPQLLPYALVAWVILLITRLFVPFVSSLGPLSVAWKVLRIALFAIVFHKVAELFLVHVFQLEETMLWSLSAWGISGVLTLIVEHTAMAAYGGHGEGHPAPGPPPDAGRNATPANE